MSEVHDTLAGLRAAYLWLAGWASLPSYLLPRLWTNAALFKPADRPPRHFQHELSPSQYCYFFPYFGLFIRKKTADEPVNLTAIHVRLLVSTTLSALRVEISQHSSCSFSPVVSIFCTSLSVSTIPVRRVYRRFMLGRDLCKGDSTAPSDGPYGHAISIAGSRLASSPYNFYAAVDCVPTDSCNQKIELGLVGLYS